MKRDIDGSTLIAQNIPVEQPFEDYTRIVVGENEFLLGKTQTKIWRKIGENDVISLKELHEILLAEGLNISFNALCEVISLFLDYKCVVKRPQLW